MPRRLAIPRTLRVRGKRWRVAFTGRRKRRDMRGVLGLCEAESRTIWIDGKCPRRVRELTLCHEVLHAIFPDGVVSSEIEERLVARMEGPLRSLLVSGALVAVPEEA